MQLEVGRRNALCSVWSVTGTVFKPPVHSNVFALFLSLFLFFENFFYFLFFETGQQTKTKIGGWTILTWKELIPNFSFIKRFWKEAHIYNRQLDESAAVD